MTDREDGRKLETRGEEEEGISCRLIDKVPRKKYSGTVGHVGADTVCACHIPASGAEWWMPYIRPVSLGQSRPLTRPTPGQWLAM